MRGAVPSGACGEQVYVRCLCVRACAARDARPCAVRECALHLCVHDARMCSAQLCAVPVHVQRPCARDARLCAAHPACGVCVHCTTLRCARRTTTSGAGRTGSPRMKVRGGGGLVPAGGGSAAPARPPAAAAVHSCIPWGLLSDPPAVLPRRGQHQGPVPEGEVQPAQGVRAAGPAARRLRQPQEAGAQVGAGGGAGGGREVRIWSRGSAWLSPPGSNSTGAAGRATPPAQRPSVAPTDTRTALR